jgi:hypothetical protein
MKKPILNLAVIIAVLIPIVHVALQSVDLYGKRSNQPVSINNITFRFAVKEVRRMEKETEAYNMDKPDDDQISDLEYCETLYTPEYCNKLFTIEERGEE